ncbi:hypothetical protein [uncultured Eudoraea sp.]|uniref:hypothetical protein n=1 Tax=uncultured Eudoraea sp. TaxID=1035614 RepID=UPI0026102694|nr:hypothetical protein [uncultured Eudoraea sp.]
MSEKLNTKPPVWFWIVSILALLWNLMGVMSYLEQAYMTDEMKEQYTADQLTLMDGIPAWVTAAFAIAVWGGLLGCIALLLRKKWAKPILLLSLIAILIQMGYSFFMTNAAEIYGPLPGIIIPLLVIIISFALVQFARIAEKRNWIT